MSDDSDWGGWKHFESWLLNVAFECGLAIVLLAVFVWLWTQHYEVLPGTSQQDVLFAVITAFEAWLAISFAAPIVFGIFAVGLKALTSWLFNKPHKGLVWACASVMVLAVMISIPIQAASSGGGHELAKNLVPWIAPEVQIPHQSREAVLLSSLTGSWTALPGIINKMLGISP